jgi:hypothetical protein
MELTTELLKVEKSCSSSAFFQLQKYRNDFDVQSQQNLNKPVTLQKTNSDDKTNLLLIDFIINSVADIDNTLLVLYLDVWTYISSNKEGLCEQKDWEFMFSLLYTQYYNFKKAGCAIYRYGVFCCDYVDGLELTKNEESLCLNELSKIKKSCFRLIQRIKSIICDVFSCHQMKNVEFTLASQEKHGIMLINKKLTCLIENIEDKECMINLKNAAQSNVKLEIFVSLHLYSMTHKHLSAN